MTKYLEKIVEYGFYLFIFLLPWQTRWIWHEGFLRREYWEYGSFSLYGTDILFLVIFLTSLFLYRGRAKKLDNFWVLILGFLLICFSSIFWSLNKEISWYFFIKLIEAVLLLWFVLRIHFDWLKLGISWVAAGVVQSIFGIYQFFSQNILSNKWLGLAAHQPDVLGDLVVETAGGRFLRAYGAFPHPNMLAGFLVVALLIIFGFLFWFYNNRKHHILGIILSVASVAIICFGLILTFSRSAWLTFVLTFLMLIAVSIWPKNKYRLRILSHITVWIILLVAFSIFLVPEIWQTRLVASGRLEVKSTQERVEYYKQSIDLIKNHWYQGVGIGSFTQATYDQDSSKEVWDYQPVHNIYLLVITEAGVFGGLIFLLIVIEFFRRIFGRYLRGFQKHDLFLVYSLAFISLLIIGLFDHYLWSLSFGLLFFWLVLGLWFKVHRQISVDNSK